MEDVRLELKTPYEYGRNNEFSNKIGFVKTKKQLTVGEKFRFEDLSPESMGGDLNTEHYSHFQGKEYVVNSEMRTRVRFGWEAKEV